MSNYDHKMVLINKNIQLSAVSHGYQQENPVSIGYKLENTIGVYKLKLFLTFSAKSVKFIFSLRKQVPQNYYWKYSTLYIVALIALTVSSRGYRGDLEGISRGSET